MKFKIIANKQTPKIDIEFKKSAQYIIHENYKMLNKFISFARKQHNCVGLAANQVSVNGKRIMEPFFVFKCNNYWQMCINPKIINYNGGGEEKIETCLTWIGKKLKVMRWPIIKVEYWDLKGDVYETTLDGFHAQIWQHEYNHLLGIEEEFI